MASQATRPDPRFARHIDECFKDDLAALFEAGEAVEGLLRTRGWGELVQILDAETARVDRDLNGDKPLEHVEYAKLHGERRGLRTAEEAARAIVARAAQRRLEQSKRHEGAGESVPER